MTSASLYYGDKINGANRNNLQTHIRKLIETSTKYNNTKTLQVKTSSKFYYFIAKQTATETKTNHCTATRIAPLPDKQSPTT